MNQVGGLPLPIRAYAAVVLLNYAAQVPYAIDLYGMHLSLAGAALLGATLLWFLVGLTALAGGSRTGYVVLTTYAAAQVAFYFHGQVLLAFAGYGMPYSLTHARDAIVWAVFVIGDVNFLAAAVTLVYLLARRRGLAAPAESRAR